MSPLLRADEQPTVPPVDGPTANDSDLDDALFGPWDGEEAAR